MNWRRLRKNDWLKMSAPRYFELSRKKRLLKRHECRAPKALASANFPPGQSWQVVPRTFHPHNT